MHDVQFIFLKKLYTILWIGLPTCLHLFLLIFTNLVNLYLVAKKVILQMNFLRKTGLEVWKDDIPTVTYGSNSSIIHIILPQ